MCLEWKGKTDFFLADGLNISEFFSCLLWPCFPLSLQDKLFVVWLRFVSVGLLLMGSENRNRAFISR